MEQEQEKRLRELESFQERADLQIEELGRRLDSIRVGANETKREVTHSKTQFLERELANARDEAARRQERLEGWKRAGWSLFLVLIGGVATAIFDRVFGK